MHAVNRSPEVIILGSGPAGVAAACAAADNGANVTLVEASPFPGGELVSGLPVDGCLNARGEWLVGGPAHALFEGCKRRGGYIGPLFDWRLNWGVCIDPVAMRRAIVEELARRRVRLMLSSILHDTAVRDGRITTVDLTQRQGRAQLAADVFVDASGDGALAMLAGAEYEQPEASALQPVSLTFRVGNVDMPTLMKFIRDYPEEFMLAESPVIDKSPAECARALYDAGLPFVPLSAKGRVLGKAIASGAVAPCTAVFMWPTSLTRREVGLNMTRLAGIDGTDNAAWSATLPELVRQVEKGAAFLKASVPGFADAVLADAAYSVGVRETRRIRGETVLNDATVREALRHADGIARGTHHIDIHGAGTAQTRIPVRGGGSYDIPFGCLIPCGLRNLLVAGRCLSSTRAANGSCRVMGTCLATGQAAGTAAAMLVGEGFSDPRQLDVSVLRARLTAQGAVLDGVA
ncbi:MAG: FAD-dependent oxidoreductase [Candidatus Marinimicrobia bacterium]|nr:FAD-dependent oxidoreductase [Candidatus Neomarinimicrobiota bacterium]